MIDNKQRQIVKGACELFLDKGFHPTTIREIAEACEMSMGQLYHYISSKDDVLYLVHEQFHLMQYDFIKSQNLEQYDDPVERLIICLRANLTFVNENKKLIQFILTETKYLQKDYLETVLKMEKEYTIDIYREILEDVNKQMKLQADLEVLSSILAFVVSFVTLRGWTLKNKSMDEINDCLIDFILKGIGIQV